jgi:hypothetical protein
MKNSKKYYILMADVIESRDQQGDELIKSFKAIVNSMIINHKDSFLSPPTITLGDEFQAIVKSLDTGVDIIIATEEFIIKNNFKFKLRYILNFGSVETEINPKVAYEMLGEGLTSARELLSEIKKDGKRFVINLDSDKSNIFNNLFFLFASIVDKWKLVDFELISSFIEKQDYKKVAQQFKRDRASVWRKEKTLQIKQYLAAKEVIKQVVKL